MTLTDQLIEQFNKMDDVQQQRLLNFAHILTQTPVIRGESGASIVAATGFFDAQSLDEMEAAIAEGCATRSRRFSGSGFRSDHARSD